MARLRENICAAPLNTQISGPHVESIQTSHTQAEGACVGCQNAQTIAEKNRQDLAKRQGQVKSIKQMRNEVAFIEYMISQSNISHPTEGEDSLETQLRDLRKQLVQHRFELTFYAEDKEFEKQIAKGERLLKIQKN